MYPVSTRGGGSALAAPDVCKTPIPYSLPQPIPYANVAQCADATGSTCTQRVKVMNKAVLHAGSEIGSTSGDEPGTLKGIVSQTRGDKAVYKSSDARVLFEGNAAVRFLHSTAHNGSNPNAPGGTQIAPSQSKVVLG